tara:strand:- start:610 stop:1509 length:900 start_codon:yes stop_codon:yes gene_type:complete
MQHEKEILKWIDGTITDSELAELRKTPEYASLAPIIEKTSNFKKPAFNVEQALEGFNRLKQPKIKVVSFNSWKKYASIAAAVVVFASLYFVFSVSNTTVSTQYAETAIFNLPDASEVVLNSGSEIVYSKKSWDKKREIKLNGEAFFKVSKGKTFDVVTDQGTVTVVGTQFNVNERDDYFEVSCFEGKVKVTANNKDVILTPGKTIKMINGVLGEITDFKAETPDWLNKQSNFDNVPFTIVVQELERQFDVKINFDKSLATKQFTGGFSHTNLNEAVESIAFPMNLKFTIKDQNLIELHE